MHVQAEVLQHCTRVGVGWRSENLASCCRHEMLRQHVHRSSLQSKRLHPVSQLSAEAATSVSMPVAAGQGQAKEQHMRRPQGIRGSAVSRPVLILAVCLGAALGPSRDWGWCAPWFATAALVFLVMLPCWAYVAAYNPDLIHEREQFLKHSDAATFERYLLPALLILAPARFLAAGLQHWLAMQQPGWTATAFLDTPGQQIAAAGVVLACLLQTWSVCSNKFFSSVVRLQTNRGHQVCSEGPYAFVRHPGYVAFSLQALCEAALMESPWAVLLAAASAGLLVVRTVHEDAFLQQNLPGYVAYARSVRYRWVPLVW